MKNKNTQNGRKGKNNEVSKQQQQQPQPQPTPNSVPERKPRGMQELVAANFAHLIEQLDSGHSEALTQYLTAMARFRNYSFGNIMLIAGQKAVT